MMMASTQDSTRNRLTPHQREAIERRTRMTRRRRELTTQIRKQKKSKYLEKKRSLPCVSIDHSATNVDMSRMISEFKALLESYCQNLVSLEQLLSTLQRFVSFIDNHAHGIQNLDNPLVVLEQNDEALAVKFLDNLREQTVKSLHNQEISSFQSSLKILVHLTSFSSGESAISSMRTSKAIDYYGRQPLTWSELLISQNSSPTSSPLPNSQAPLWMEIIVQSLLSSKEVELASLVLGNLVGDDSAARTIFKTISDDFKTSMVNGLIRSVSPRTPTAAWTLTNMIRNDSFSYARTYCSEALLSTSLLMKWLCEPSLVTQTAWMIASLTAREEEIALYLCGDQYCFLSAIIQSIQNPLQPDQTIPLVKALGNLACHPSLIAPLLTQTTPNLIPILQKLLSTTSSRDPLLIEVVWLAGCLLVDVGEKHHPSTTVAAPALIPILVDRLGDGRSEEGDNQLMTGLTLEEERECASAIWNALDDPPSADILQEQSHSLMINQNRRSNSFELPFKLNFPRSMLQSIVHLINSNDSDAVLSGVSVIDLILKRENDQYLITIMEEEEVPDALERICDSPMEEAANVAADVLDDFFYDENHHGIESVESSSVWTNGFPASIPASGIGVASPVASGPGRGRGRGATIPAWMAK